MLDLEAIETRLESWYDSKISLGTFAGFAAAIDIPALIAEVRKLRAQLHDKGLDETQSLAPFHPYGEPL